MRVIYVRSITSARILGERCFPLGDRLSQYGGVLPCSGLCAVRLYWRSSLARVTRASAVPASGLFNRRAVAVDANVCAYCIAAALSNLFPASVCDRNSWAVSEA